MGRGISNDSGLTKHRSSTFEAPALFYFAARSYFYEFRACHVTMWHPRLTVRMMERGGTPSHFEGTSGNTKQNKNRRDKRPRRLASLFAERWSFASRLDRDCRNDWLNWAGPALWVQKLE
jgi:hypothetical protein